MRNTQGVEGKGKRRLQSRQEALRKIQALIRRYVPAGESLVLSLTNYWLSGVQRLSMKQMKPAAKMTEKLTTYDPAEDLSSNRAIAIFMAEAFLLIRPSVVL